jgi:hypothetical protein
MKVYIDWYYDIDPSPSNTWSRTKTIQDCDVVVSINNNKYYNKKTINWLYEPESIISSAYKNCSNSNNYIATHRVDLSFNNKITIPPCFPSWIDECDRKIYNKTKLVSMIASKKNICSGHSIRQQVADTNENNLNLYGFGRKNQLDKKIEGLKDYMFSVAMENSIADIYYTEKLLDCFLTGTIPVYWGSKKINDIFDKNGIIFLNEDMSIPTLTEEIYISKLESIKNNFELANKYNYKASDGIQFITEQI